MAHYNVELIDFNGLDSNLEAGYSKVVSYTYKNVGNVAGTLILEGFISIDDNSAYNPYIDVKFQGITINLNESLEVPNFLPGDTFLLELSVSISDEDTSNSTLTNLMSVANNLTIAIDAKIVSTETTWVSNTLESVDVGVINSYEYITLLFTYVDLGNSYSITGFNLARINADLGGVKPRNITIPNMYNGKLVSSISNQAFKGGNQFINSHLLFLLRTSRSYE